MGVWIHYWIEIVQICTTLVSGRLREDTAVKCKLLENIAQYFALGVSVAGRLLWANDAGFIKYANPAVVGHKRWKFSLDAESIKIGSVEV